MALEEPHQSKAKDEYYKKETCGSKQTHFLCYILHIDQWGFRCTMLQDRRERCRRASMSWTVRAR